MRKALVIVPVVVAAAIAAYALSPYFTESMVDEALPAGALIRPVMDDVEIIDDSMTEEERAEMAAEEMEKTRMAEEARMAGMDIPMTYAGTFVGVNDGIHNAEGRAYTIPLEDGSSVLRLEDFRATNGPDLHVYLSADKGASDIVALGQLKANMGNQNYDIPEGTDLDKYSNVLIWCKPFSVLFGSAEILPQQ